MSICLLELALLAWSPHSKVGFLENFDFTVYDLNKKKGLYIPVGFATIIDHFFGRRLAIFVLAHCTIFTAQITGKCVGQIIGKFVGPQTRNWTEFDHFVVIWKT